MQRAWNLVSQAMQSTLFTLSGTAVTGATLVTSFLVVLAGVGLSRLVRRAVRTALRLRGVETSGRWDTLLRFLHYVIVGLASSMALETLGIELSGLFAAGAVFAVGIGFAMQNIAQNFVSGVILMAEGVIKHGDVLEVDGLLVRVDRLGIRSTVARTLFDEDLVIPNALLVQSTVKNFTLRDRLFRLRVGVGVTYSSDMVQVEETLRRVAQECPFRERSREPRVQMIEFGASSVDWEVSLWIEDPFNQRSRGAELRSAIWFALKDAGIGLAFPQLDLHVDAEVVAALRAGREGLPPGR